MDSDTIKKICRYYDEQETENEAMLQAEEDRHQKVLENLRYSRRPHCGIHNEWAVAFRMSGLEKTPARVEEVAQYMRNKTFIKD